MPPSRQRGEVRSSRSAGEADVRSIRRERLDGFSLRWQAVSVDGWCRRLAGTTVVIMLLVSPERKIFRKHQPPDTNRGVI